MLPIRNATENDSHRFVRAGQKTRFRRKLSLQRTKKPRIVKYPQESRQASDVSQPDLNVRFVRATDYDSWCALWRGYLTFYETSVSEAVYDSTFARLLGDDPQDFNGLVAEQDGRLVGLTHYLFHRHCWKIENVCYLQDLFAVPEARGLGVGRALIEAVYTKADEADAPSVYWTTQDFNHTARQLYDRIGQLTPFIKYQRG